MKELINVFGIPMNVMSEEEIAAQAATGEPVIYMVMRVTDMDFRGALELQSRVFTMNCEKCAAQCWVDPAAYNPLRAMNLIITCNRCMMAKARREQRRR
jgi:hypothetical protein